MLDIQPVGQNQRSEWEPLFKGYADFYQTNLGPDGIDTVWDWIHSPDQPLQAVMAWKDGQALGLAQFQLMHRPSQGKMTCYLSDLFTTPQARGHGVGRALIDYLRAWAAEQGSDDLRWLTNEDNATARKLYDRYAPKSPFILYSIPSKTS